MERSRKPDSARKRVKVTCPLPHVFYASRSQPIRGPRAFRDTMPYGAPRESGYQRGCKVAQPCSQPGHELGVVTWQEVAAALKIQSTSPYESLLWRPSRSGNQIDSHGTSSA